jgi:hypothetical protein
MDTVSLYNSTDATFHINATDREFINDNLEVLCSASIWLGILLTLFVSLILLSTKVQRRGPIFWLQTAAFFLALVYNILNQLQTFWEYDILLKLPQDHPSRGREGRSECKKGEERPSGVLRFPYLPMLPSLETTPCPSPWNTVYRSLPTLQCSSR